MTQINCPSCGAPSEAGPEDLLLVCDHCKTCFTTAGATVKEHYLLPAHYVSSDAVERLILWIKKQVGAEEDLPLHLQIDSTQLGYYPFWHIEIQASTAYAGLGMEARYFDSDGANEFKGIQEYTQPKQGSIERHFPLTFPASKQIPAQLLNYSFPTQSKKYFSQSYAKDYGGQIYPGNADEVTITNMAKQEAQNQLTSLILTNVREVTSRNDSIDVTSVYYLHAPVWSVRYRFQSKAYQALVDATTGRVIQATYPVSLEYRAQTGAIAAGHFVVGAALLLLFLGVFPSFALTLGGGLLAFGAVFLFRALSLGRGKEAEE